MGEDREAVRDSVGTTGDGSAAALAVPDTDSLPADGDLSAEGAGVLGVLGDFHLLHLLTQGGTVTKILESVLAFYPSSPVVNRPSSVARFVEMCAVSSRDFNMSMPLPQLSAIVIDIA